MTRFVLSSLLLFVIYAQAQQKNILFIISDDLNTRIGPYMNIDEHTPNLDRLAKEGVKFTKTYSQYPVCGPSRASIMSGLYPETNGVLSNSYTKGSYRGQTPALADHPSLAGFFREQGYFTARVSKIFHMGVPGGIERGEAGDDDPDSWDFALNILGPETLSSGKLELLSPQNHHYGGSFVRMKLKDGLETTQTDYMATTQAIAILESRAAQVAPNATNAIKHKPGAPFFLAVGLVRPHLPFIAPENTFEPYPDDEMELPEVIVGDNVPKDALRNQNHRTSKMNEEQKKKSISGYMASVRFMDQQVGRLLDALDRLGLRDDTIVVFVSDHGFNLGEHDCWSKLSLWEGSVRVPLIVSHPDASINHGTTYEGITELIDLYPTLTELTEMTEQQPKILQGKSLANAIWQPKESIPEALAYTVTYRGKGASIRTKRYRYNRWGYEVGEQNEELYDHVNDPEEHYNLAYGIKHKKVLKEMRSLLNSKREQASAGN